MGTMDYSDDEWCALDSMKQNDLESLQNLIPNVRDEFISSHIFWEAGWGVMSQDGGTKTRFERERMDDAMAFVLQTCLDRGLDHVVHMGLFDNTRSPMQRACETLSLKTALLLIDQGVGPLNENGSVYATGKPLMTPSTSVLIKAQAEDFELNLKSAHNAKIAVNLLDEIAKPYELKAW